MPFSSTMVAYSSIKIFLFVTIFFCFFIFFMFFDSPNICNHQACDHTHHTFGSFIYIVYYRLLAPSLFLSLHFCFQFLYQWFNFSCIISLVSTSSPLPMRQFSSPSRITSYSLGKIVRMWIIKSPSFILTFKLSSFIQI